MSNKRPFNFGPALFLIIYQSLLLISLPFYFYFFQATWIMGLVTLVLLYLTGLSITAGYHRYYSHRSYRTGSAVEAVLLFFGSMACQGSALRWSFDHRIHHAHVDTDEDPYSIKKGFWYAHCLWILEKPRKIEEKVVSDLMKNKLVMFQHKYYRTCMIGSNVLSTLFFGWLLNDYAGAFFLSCFLRLFLLHHFTWFINSLAHMWGEKPFCQELSAVDNYFLSVLTFGEGYHNYHHTFANDYRNGIRWYHFDPTKWLIWTLYKCGLVYHLRKMDKLTIEKKIVLESRNAILERIQGVCSSKKDEIENAIQQLSESMVAKITHFNKMKEEYLSLKQAGCRDSLRQLKQEMRRIKKSLRHDWKEWTKFSRHAMELSLASA